MELFAISLSRVVRDGKTNSVGIESIYSGSASGEVKLIMKRLFAAFTCLFLVVVASVAQEVPKAEVYLGYGFVRFYPNPSPNAFTANGGFGSAQYNFNRYFSVVGELGGVTNNAWTVANGVVEPSQTFFTYMFGPRVYFNKTGVVSPFIEYLVGGFHNSRSTDIDNALLPNPLPPLRGVGVRQFANFTRFNTTQNAAAMAVGGGVDLRLSRLIAVRPIQLDYLPTNFSPLNITGLGAIPGVPSSFNRTRWQQNLRYSAGVTFRFGGAPPTPPTVACAVTPSELLPWAGPVNATVSPSGFNPRRDLDFNWTSTSGAVSGNGSSATVDTTNLQPGEYTVKANVSDPRQHTNGSASCSASFTVKQPQSPQVACSATPASVHPGDPITLRVEGSSPDQSKIQSRNFRTSAGTIKQGETTAGAQPGEFTSVATLDTTNVAPGPLSVNIDITDVHGLSGSATCTASVVAPPAPEVVSESLISDCEFNNPKKHARVDNQCKAVLDEVALRLQHEPNGKLVVVGCSDEQESVSVSDVSSRRAVNTKAYLTGGEAKQQIDSARIEVRKSTNACGRKARFYFVPEGGSFTQTDTVIVDESSLPADRTTAPSKHHKKSKTATPSGE